MKDLIVVVATCATALVAPWRAAAQEDPQEQESSEQEYSIDISRQPVTPAIHVFSDQTELDIGFFPERPEDESILVGPVQGTLTADAALLQLLNPSGFEYEWVSAGSVRVFKQPTQASATAKNAEARTVSGSPPAQRRWPGGRSQYDDIDFVIVLGTRISSLETESQSVAVIDEQQVDSYGASTVSELLEYLPQIPFMTAEHMRATGEQFADLRGLGAGTTMILINGRRVAGTATSFDTGGFDVNTIPLTAVKRLEVLLDAPSVSIGTDTVAGVINVVLKDEIPEPTVEVRYGAADGGAEEQRLSAGIGTTRESFRGTATFDIFQRKPLMGSEREPVRNQDYRRFGGTDYRSLNASPGNVFSLTPENLPGLDSPFAGVPEGSSGVSLTPQDLTSTAGHLNRSSLSRFESIVPEVWRLSFVTSAELKLSPSVISFAEIFAANRKLEEQQGPPTLSGAIVPMSNAFNPFETPVAVDTLLEGAPTRIWTTDATLVRAIAGVRREWSDWEAEIAATWMEDRARVSRENELDPSRVAQALASSDPGAALNVFRDGPPGSAALLASLVAPPQVRRYSSDIAQGYARAEGPLLTLPGGDVRLIFGGEWRKEELSTFSLLTSAGRTVSAAFAELHAPLIGAEMNMPAPLAVSIGVRNDHHSGVGSRNSPQYGFVWRPHAALKFRASYSESYRPPLLFDLYAPHFPGQLTFPDPRRGHEISTFAATHGGNTDLVPTQGHTWTTGVEFTPRDLAQLHVSVGYWRTTLANQILSLNLFSLFAHEELYPGRVIRADPSPQDIEAGIPGPVQMVDMSPGNFGRLTAAGVDLNFSFTWDTSIGRFRPTLSAVWNDDFNAVLAQGAPSEDRIGIARAEGTIPRWRAVASTLWSRGPLSAFVAAQFVSAYDDALTDGTENGRTIPATVVFDTQASLRIGELAPPTSILSGVELTAGVKNVFDKRPHFAEAGWEYGYDFTQHDLRQRFWYLRLAKKF